MRILYHHRTASKDGQSTHIEEMVSAFRRQGHTVLVVAPSVDDSSQTGGSGGWVGTLKRHLPLAVYELMELSYSAVAFVRLMRSARSFRPDVIYERYNLFFMAGIFARKILRVPLILEVNAPMAQERRVYGGLSLAWLADKVESATFCGADAVLPVSHVLAAYLAKQGVDERRISVVPNGINVEDYASVPSNEEAKSRLNLSGRLVIGFTGFVREWDQLDRVVDWLAAYKGTENPHLLIVGDGPARESITQRAQELGVLDKVTFTGVVSRRDVPACAAAFDIALQTALVPYASPLCLFEYLALGIAVIAPDQPNHHELLEDGVTAVFFKPDVAGDLERAISELSADAALRARVGPAGRQSLIQRRLTWSNHAEKIIGIATHLSDLQANGGSQT